MLNTSSRRPTLKYRILSSGGFFIVSLIGAAEFFVTANRALAADALAEKPSIESRYLSNIRQVTSGFVRAGEGYFSPDGRTIIYQAVPQDYPFYQIYTQPLSGGKPSRVSTGRGK